jgi:hypothetical protein
VRGASFRSPTGRYEFRHWRERPAPGEREIAWELRDGGEVVASGWLEPERWLELASDALPEVLFAPDESALALVGYGAAPVVMYALPGLRYVASVEDLCDVREAWIEPEGPRLWLREWDYVGDEPVEAVLAFDLATGEELTVFGDDDEDRADG